MSSRHVECKIVTTDEDGHQLEYYVFLCQEIILVSTLHERNEAITRL